MLREYRRNVNASLNCRKERDMALLQNKRIIPLFEEFTEVPPACQPYLSVNVSAKLPQQIAVELHKLIRGAAPVASSPRPAPQPPSLGRKPFFGKLVLEPELQALKTLQAEIGTIRHIIIKEKSY